MTPQRFQRLRVQGYRMPEGSIFVGRPTRWGNPYLVGHGEISAQGMVRDCWVGQYDGTARFVRYDLPLRVGLTAEEAVALYRDSLVTTINGGDPWEVIEALESLRGKDLVCYCPLDQACHANVLLDLANR